MESLGGFARTQVPRHVEPPGAIVTPVTTAPEHLWLCSFLLKWKTEKYDCPQSNSEALKQGELHPDS